MKNLILFSTLSIVSYSAYSMKQSVDSVPLTPYGQAQAIAERDTLNPEDYKEVWMPVDFGSQPVSSEQKVAILTTKLQEAQFWAKRFCGSCRAYQNAIDMRDRMSAQDFERFNKEKKQLQEEIERLKNPTSSDDISGTEQDASFILKAAQAQIGTMTWKIEKIQRQADDARSLLHQSEKKNNILKQLLDEHNIDYKTAAEDADLTPASSKESWATKNNANAICLPSDMIFNALAKSRLKELTKASSSQ